MGQPLLFDLGSPDMPAVRTDVRSTCPVTSHIAAEKHERSGKMVRNRKICRSLVQRHPGCTAIELWHKADAETQELLKEPQEVRRRLYDLCKVGSVRQAERRNCTIRGTSMVTWMEDVDGVF